MEHNGHARTLDLHASCVRGGADGAIHRGQRDGAAMGSKKQKEPLARRDQPSNMRGVDHGDQDIAKGDTDNTVEPKLPQAPTAKASELTVCTAAGRVVEGDEAVKAKRYSPPGCSACAAIRPAGKNYTEVYNTRKEGGYRFRYCRCRYCGHTFKDAVKE